jgi:hypothetical protein
LPSSIRNVNLFSARTGKSSHLKALVILSYWVAESPWVPNFPETKFVTVDFRHAHSYLRAGDIFLKLRDFRGRLVRPATGSLNIITSGRVILPSGRTGTTREISGSFQTSIRSISGGPIHNPRSAVIVFADDAWVGLSRIVILDEPILRRAQSLKLSL